MNFASIARIFNNSPINQRYDFRDSLPAGKKTHSGSASESSIERYFHGHPPNSRVCALRFPRGWPSRPTAAQTAPANNGTIFEINYLRKEIQNEH